MVVQGTGALNWCEVGREKCSLAHWPRPSFIVLVVFYFFFLLFLLFPPFGTFVILDKPQRETRKQRGSSILNFGEGADAANAHVQTTSGLSIGHGGALGTAPPPPDCRDISRESCSAEEESW